MFTIDHDFTCIKSSFYLLNKFFSSPPSTFGVYSFSVFENYWLGGGNYYGFSIGIINTIYDCFKALAFTKDEKETIWGKRKISWFLTSF